MSDWLERALAKSEKLGARALLARGHYLLASALRSTGSAADASRHLAEARRLLEEIRKEAKTDDVGTTAYQAGTDPVLPDGWKKIAKGKRRVAQKLPKDF